MRTHACIQSYITGSETEESRRVDRRHDPAFSHMRIDAGGSCIFTFASVGLHCCPDSAGKVRTMYANGECMYCMHTRQETVE